MLVYVFCAFLHWMGFVLLPSFLSSFSSRILIYQLHDFIPFCWLLLHFVAISFTEQKFLSLVPSHLFILALIVFSGVFSKKSLSICSVQLVFQYTYECDLIKFFKLINVSTTLFTNYFLFLRFLLFLSVNNLRSILLECYKIEMDTRSIKIGCQEVNK